LLPSVRAAFHDDRVGRGALGDAVMVGDLVVSAPSV